MARRGWGRAEYDRYSGYGGFAPYVSVGQRKAKAAAHAKRLEKESGRKMSPIKIEGRTIAASFWGKSWCDNLEAYSDFANRLPRGKTYVRNGSVIDLQIAEGKVTALVSGSEIYEISISIATLERTLWGTIQRDCAESISSLVNLLQGRFDRGVMDRLTRRGDGLFPQPQEIQMKCSCPDYAGLCKHLAAVMYAVGARLDAAPELLFTLRSVDHLELIGQAVSSDNLDQALSSQSDSQLADSDLGQMFGIELETLEPATNRAASRGQKPLRPGSKGMKGNLPAQLKTAFPAKAAAAKPKKAKSAVAKSAVAKSAVAKSAVAKSAVAKTGKAKSTVVSPQNVKSATAQPIAAKSAKPAQASVTRAKLPRQREQEIATITPARAAAATKSKPALAQRGIRANAKPVAPIAKIKTKTPRARATSS